MNFSKKKHSLNTKHRILIVVLPLVILPIIVISLYATINFYNKSFVQNKEFYQGIISQVTTNIDFYYNQYATYFNDISESPIFKSIIGQNVKHFKPLRELLLSKISASLYLLELNYPDKEFNLPYRFSRVTESLIQIDVDVLRKDDIFKALGKNPANPMMMGSTKAAKGMSSERMPIFFYPYEFDKHGKPQVVLIAIETANFLNNLYKQNTKLKLGTIYIQDQFGHVLDYNHPYIDDYYEYDEEKNRYILNPGDDPNDPYEGMSFAEYRMLNTDPEILSESVVKEQIKDAEEKNSVSTKIIEYKGKKYLSIIAVAQNSKMHVAYFHPINQLFGPVQKSIYITILLAILTVIAAIFIILSFSKHFTNPIVELKMRLKKICCGEYDEHLNAKNFFGEFITLSGSFNTMLDTINNYRNNMEQIVHERTEELNKTVAQLTETHEQNKRGLAMAQKIQSSLVPKVFPETKLLQFSSKYMPMEALGGDLYDVYQISDKVFAIMILDVCGHGVPAALITTMAKISFNTNAKKSKDPSEVVFNVNNELFDSINGNGDYFTAFYGVIDIEKGKLYYSNAGHNTIFLAHSDGTLDQLENNGPVVGVVRDLPFVSAEHVLKNGDRLVLYTDGVIEARDEQAALYGEERLMDIIKQNMNSEVKDFTEHVFTDLQAFCGNSPRCDDIALFAVDIVGIE
jgi:serine phosphatase RsbU (regulator of sigma subunit)